MKTAYKIISLLFIIIFLASCDEFLTQESPSVVQRGDFWKSPSEAAQGVAAIYDEAQSTFNLLMYGELRADNYELISGPLSSIVEMQNNTLTSNNTYANWGDFYTTIATANLAIQNIQDMSNFKDKDDLLAQSYALRALSYFWAVRIWGNIPKMTKSVEEFKQEYNITKAPSDEIFADIIIPDLQKAEQLASNSRNIHEMSLGGVLALKAHVYAWPGSYQDYSVARKAIAQLEGLGYYNLETTQEGWIDMFQGEPQNSDEIIFSLEWSYPNDGANPMITLFSQATPEHVISSNLRQSWDPAEDDFRRDVSFVEKDENFPIDRNLHSLNKYSGRWALAIERQGWSSSNQRDMIFYRMSGLLLLKAEVENYMDKPSNSLATLNRVRAARGLDQVDESITDQATIRDMILEERRFELLGEGYRFWDLVRNGVATDVLDNLDDVQKIVWPVSQDVLDRNPNMTQNETYK